MEIAIKYRRESNRENLKTDLHTRNENSKPEKNCFTENISALVVICTIFLKFLITAWLI